MLMDQPAYPAPQQKSDEEIARLVQTGNVDVFGELVGRYEQKLKRYGKKFLAGDEAAVEDAVQEAFLKAYQNILSFDVQRRFSPWIYRIAHNEFVNLLKKKKSEPMRFFDTDIIFPHPVAKERTEQRAEERLMSELIDQCMDKLSVKYREPLVLYYFEQQSYEEIADILHIPVSTVGVRLKRGRKAVQLLCQKLGYTL
jgi:RNA polymerase sigma-70 factor (ECF subfamily)